MELTWYGHACFRLKERNNVVITDPYDKTLGLPLPHPKADIVTISHDHPHHNHTAGLKGEFKIVDGPGEYEIGGIFINGIQLSAPKKKGSAVNGDQNNIFVFYMDDLAICHLGDLSHVPTQNQVEDMGSIDVLLIPVGGQNALNSAQAAEVISLIEPQIVAPMHYNLPGLEIKLDPVEKFLKEMGITKAEKIEALKVTKSSLPEETQIILLEAKS
jgi:L-ascorbate metabolism protein UlaG (beta-lactamase superfamily)